LAFFIQELNELLRRKQDLPTLPDVVFQLHAALEDENVSQGQIAAIIDRDPALTARMLRVGNSALFNTGAKISTVLGAIQRLGIREVRATCIVLSVVKCFSDKGAGLNHQHFWDHCAAVGLTTRMLWRKLRRRGGSVGADDLYVAGLLHDVGLLLLDQFFPESFQETQEVHQLSEDPLWKCEDLVLGMDHGEIGALLLGSWKLPELLSRVVAAHHHPDTAPEEVREAAHVVHVAEQLCCKISTTWQVEGASGLDQKGLLAAFGLDPVTIEDIIQELDAVAAGSGGLLQAA
jgi:putative nucleotidyltransferase with HDIG domain